MDGLARIASLGGLARKHDAVGAVSDSVTNIADLSTGGAGVLDHGLEHLSRADDGLASHVAHGDQLLLGRKDLSRRDLDSELEDHVSTRS